MKTSKLFYFCICLLCTAAILFGCSLHGSPSKEPVPSFVQSEPSQPVTISTEPQPTDIKEENPFLTILAGTGTFLYEGNTVTLDDYCATFGISAALTAVTVADLEGDSVPEVVLDVKVNPEYSYGVLVLHMENSEVWGYTFAQRQLQEIKKDGTFTWSAGASNNGVATLSLSAGAFEYKNQFWVEETEDGTSRFFIGGAESTSEDYYAALTEWEAKEGTAWNPYPMDSYISLF